MKELLETLRKNKTIYFGGKADVHHNIDARKFLAEEGFAVFPDEFFSLVKYANGIRNDQAAIYAILPEEDDTGFADAVWVNDALNRQDRTTVAVLGETNFDYLVYDTKTKQYQLRDKESDDIINRFSSLSDAIKRIFAI